MAKKKRSKKHSLSPGFQRERQEKLVRRYRKTILLNEKELSLLHQYCEKYGIRNKSAFIRNVLISHILEQIDDNYPRLF